MKRKLFGLTTARNGVRALPGKRTSVGIGSLGRFASRSVMRAMAKVGVIPQPIAAMELRRAKVASLPSCAGRTVPMLGAKAADSLAGLMTEAQVAAL